MKQKENLIYGTKRKNIYKACRPLTEINRLLSQTEKEIQID